MNFVMAHKTLLWKLLYVANWALIVGLIAHQIYIHVTEPDIQSVHQQQIEQIVAATDNQAKVTFAVVGNINNSHAIFRDEIIPRLNSSHYQFMVSAGNAVGGGQPESYRSLHNIFSKLQIPYVLTFGENEQSDFGSYKFYEQFGPYVYDFMVGQNHFIFLDGTGKTPFNWQLSWLNRVFSQQAASRRIVFIGLPLHPQLDDSALFQDEDYFTDQTFAAALKNLFQQHQVDMVFSSNLPIFAELAEKGTRYITTGGAGGLMLEQTDHQHHYLSVALSADDISVTTHYIQNSWPWWRRLLVSIWSAIQSVIYVSVWRLMLVVGVLVVLASYLHRNILRERDYYPDFDVDSTPYMNRPLRVAMYSNNYFPFVSGVTISIERLRSGLRQLGDKLLLIVPTYRQVLPNEAGVVRAATLFASGKKGEFRFANFLSWRLLKAIKHFKADIIHVHHPFGLGWLGQFMGWVLKVPVVYTYHTRLEHYAHFVPLPELLFRNIISHWLISRFCNNCQGVIVPTQSAEEYLRQIGVRVKTLVQATGIEAEKFQQADTTQIAALRDRFAIAESCKVLLSVARLSKEKNIEFMLEALAAADYECPDYKLLLVGDGPYKVRLQQRIEALGLNSKVMLTGHVAPEDMPQYYQLADLFVFASQSETQGMVILEAMAAGTPVVAVRSSGIDDVINDGVTGFKTFNNMRQWSSKVITLLADDDLRKEQGMHAAEFAKSHDVKPVSKAIREFYCVVLAQYNNKKRSAVTSQEVSNE